MKAQSGTTNIVPQCALLKIHRFLLNGSRAVRSTLLHHMGFMSKYHATSTEHPTKIRLNFYMVDFT